MKGGGDSPANRSPVTGRPEGILVRGFPWTHFSTAYSPGRGLPLNWQVREGWGVQTAGKAAWRPEIEDPPPPTQRAHVPPPFPAPPSLFGGNSHHPEAERRAPEGASCLARNDCPSVNNLLLPRAWGQRPGRSTMGFWS